VVDKDSWKKPPIFSFLQEKGQIPEAEMYRTFNMGIGMMAVVNEDDVEAIMQHFRAMGEEPFMIGEILAAQEGESQVGIR
jgi:phosphoribosylformylglycinamidine cyclo-ligase